MCAMFVSSGFLSNKVSSDAIHWQSLPPFLRVLLTTDGTVTKSLESFFWEPVNVMAVAQNEKTLTCALSAIRANKGDKVWQRDVTLQGDESGRVYATARSYIRLNALPEKMQRALIQNEMGIGEFLRECEYETYREILDIGKAQKEEGERVWRTYRIMMNKQPLMQITEWFDERLFK